MYVAAVAVLAADFRGLLDESPELARIRLDILGSHKSMPVLRIGKRRMQVFHYRIVASDAYNGYMPQHFVLVCWVSRSTSLREFFACLYNKGEREGHFRTDECSISKSWSFRASERSRKQWRGAQTCSIGTRRASSGMPRHFKLRSKVGEVP